MSFQTKLGLQPQNWGNHCGCERGFQAAACGWEGGIQAATAAMKGYSCMNFIHCACSLFIIYYQLSINLFISINQSPICILSYYISITYLPTYLPNYPSTYLLICYLYIYFYLLNISFPSLLHKSLYRHVKKLGQSTSLSYHSDWTMMDTWVKQGLWESFW